MINFTEDDKQLNIKQKITVKPICPCIGVVVYSIIIHNLKTIPNPEVSMHLYKLWAKVTPVYGNRITMSHFGRALLHISTAIAMLLREILY